MKNDFINNNMHCGQDKESFKGPKCAKTEKVESEFIYKN